MEVPWYFLAVARDETSGFEVCLFSSPYLRYALFGGQMARRQWCVRPVIFLSLISEGLEEISSPECVSSDSVRVYVGHSSEGVLWLPKGLNDGIVASEYF